MNSIPKKKLDRIAEIWKYYIWKYEFCRKQLKFNADLRTNYFGDILNYFSDTFSVINREHTSSSFQGNFEDSISFLQAIYIQQDFVEELHFIFKTGVTKGDLKKDSNYTINRDLRNELIGHPIRKTLESEGETERCPTCGTAKDNTKKKQVLLSSVLFSNEIDSRNISYVRYHRDNRFQFELVTHSKEDILKRHNDFLNSNFDEILNTLKKILKAYLKKLKEIDKFREKGAIEVLIKLLEISFEDIFKGDYLFQPSILIELSKKRNENFRYEYALELFYRTLDTHLKESIGYIEEFLDDKDRFSNPNYYQEKVFTVSEKREAEAYETNESYTYELGKLVDKAREWNFEFFISSLESRCKENEEAINEINHMKLNLDNDLEYYSAYQLLRKILKAD